MVSLPQVASRPIRKAWSSFRSVYGSHTVPCSDSSSFMLGNRVNQPCRMAAPTGLHRRPVAVVKKTHWKASMSPSITSGSFHSSP